MKRPRDTEEGPDTDGLTLLHRSRLVPWSLAAVTCIAACPDGSVFAAGYDDGKVEVFDATLFNCLARIPGSDGSEVTSVAWAKAAGDPHWRLFASTLGGSLLELSCQQLQPIASTDSFGGAFWCVRPAPSRKGGVVTQLAAACGDGSVKLYSIHAHVPGAEYVRSLGRVEGHVLALAWHPDARSLVSGGSDGCIHTWDVKQGTELQRINVGTRSTSPPCVWSLTVLPNGTVVSGDGDGAVQFWDGRFGTLLSRQQQFAADVLAVVGSPDGKSVWASGVDPRVAAFHLVPDKATGVHNWVYLDRKQPHTHDVRSLAVLERPDYHPLLISGGVDGQLVMYNLDRFLKEHPTRQSKAPQRPLLQLSGGFSAGSVARLMQVQQHTVNIWQLGRPVLKQHRVQGATGAHHYEGDSWDLAALPRQVASITTSSSHHITAAALAPNGAAVAAADRNRLRIFRLIASADCVSADQQQQEEGGEQAVQRVKVQGSLDSPVLACVFSSDGKTVYAATAAGTLISADASSGDITASQQLAAVGGSGKGVKAANRPAGSQQQHEALASQPQPSAAGSWSLSSSAYMPRVSHMSASPNGELLAVVTSSGVELYATPALQHRTNLQLLGDPAPITAVSFSPNSKFIAVATAANSVIAYSTDTGLPTQWSLKNHVAAAELLQQLPGSITGLSFRPTPAEPLSLLVHSSGGLCHIDMAAQLSGNRPSEKVPRSKANPAIPQPDALAELGRNGRLLKLQHCCLFMGYTSASEAVLIEKPWQDVLRQLVPPLHRHRYGT